MKRILTSLILALLLAACNSGGGGNDNQLARLNTVSHWNHVANDASGFDHSELGVKEQAGPVKASRAMAIIHIAMHDAIQSIEKRFETYTDLADADPTASVEAAIAQAAHDTTVALFPAQNTTCANELAEDLATIADGPAKTAGIQAGAAAAAAILANRQADGFAEASSNANYTPSNEPGRWRPDPVNPSQSPLAPNWGKIKPFVMSRSSQFRAPPPPAITSAAYAESYAEVYRLGGDGIVTPTDRTEDQTIAGIYWAYDGTPSLCAPPRLYNQIALQLAVDRGITGLGDLARFLAHLNIAMADAGAAAWETKYFYDYWRPVTGIRESDAGTGPTGKGDGNALTPGDVNYNPLGAPASNLSANNFTPPFPAYVSGHATFGGAIFQVMRNHFGTDNVPFTFISDEYNGITLDNNGNSRPLIERTFSSLSQAEEENGQSRIYLGIHWSFDKTEGITMGNKVANLVTANTLKPR